MSINRRILLITYYFPPLTAAQSIRWFYLSRELSKLGYDIDVLTIKMSERFRDLLSDVPEKIAVYRTFPGPFYYLTFRYSAESHRNEKAPGNTDYLWRILSAIHFKAYKALNLFSMPDIQSEWFPFAITRGLELINTNKYRVIISSSDPRVCHLLGYFLKKRSGIPWIADYGDPWIWPMPNVPEPKSKRSILEKLEKKIVRDMDAITVAAEGMKSLYLEKYPFLDKEKIQVITQGFDPELFSQVKEETSTNFRIVFCGSFYRKIRDPIGFFEAIKEIDKEDIEVIIAGRIGPFMDTLRKEHLTDKINYRGFLNHKQSLALQKSAAVLLHIGNITDAQVPGKIYEYIGARRPILCIRGGTGDASAEFVIRYNKGIVVNNNKEAIKAGIMRLYELWEKDLLDTRFNIDIIEDFTWRKSAENITGIIEDL